MSKKERNIAIGAAVGLAAGYVAGILTAKKPGKETRADIKNTVITTKHEAEKKIKELSNELGGLLKTAEAKLKDTKFVAHENLTKVVASARDARDKARQIISSLHDGDAPDDELKQAVSEATDAIAHLKKYLDTLAKEPKKSK